MRRMILISAILLSALASPVQADDWGPWEAPREGEPAVRRPPKVSLNPLKAGVLFFQRFISPVDGPRCRMYPTCSAYALQALDKHGPFIGTLLTVDRLLHEGSPEEHRHPVGKGGRERFYDPVENNDFWLEKNAPH